MKERTKRLVGCLVVGAALLALFPGQAGATKYAGEFLSLGVGARALGMGGAFVAVADDASATFWNPAGLTQIEGREVSIMHAEQFAGMVSYDWISYVHPHQAGSRSVRLGLSLMRLGVGDIPITALPDKSRPLSAADNRPYVAHWASDAEYALLISVARQTQSSLAWGGNVKMIRKSLDEYAAWGLGVDAGVLYRPTGQFSLGATLQNATTTLIAWDNGTRETIAPTLQVGGAYTMQSDLLHGTIVPALDINFGFEGRRYASRLHWNDLSADVRIGAEYWYERLFAVRIGADELGRFAAGAGFRLHRLSRSLHYASIDFAFLSKGDLDNTYRISASVGL